MRRPILSDAKSAATWLRAPQETSEDRSSRLFWHTLGTISRVALALPILACLLVAWVLAAILAAVWIAISFLGRNDPLDFDE